LVAGGDRRQPADTDIHASFPVGHRQRCRRNVDDETRIVVTVGFADDRDRRRFAGQLA
jgi:hypothetical protein